MLTTIGLPCIGNMLWPAARRHQHHIETQIIGIETWTACEKIVGRAFKPFALAWMNGFQRYIA